ncbi:MULTISPECIES: SulP family inorganic anion transporter [Marisediminitalea]|jgi:MFS superfamily sulfate permease-like transporter|uniref:SulP family inorganic anion transporter n=2 Tax=Alteromonadaceae TaxID=72275 RepID=UPI0020CE6405|nr:SulP family inorganic anion transporter [Marisediminitalea aggregata]MCP9478888.1 SulP family inorganic anion transporter [Marisediminitalea aggregata]|tara:strand:+ start:337 stop:1878 length:1542 start_codon:yes stop_codon:yes gene_type:complete
MMKMDLSFKHIKQDLPASIVVFFVALPLCLGIALASGAPLFSGIIAGIVGGIVVGMASGSRLGVSGPAAGLAVIVFDAIATLGSWELFLCAVVLAGVFQIALGYLRAGFVAYFFPTSVITGMLTGIGLLIILKQLPYLLGWHADFLGEQAFQQFNGENTFSAITHAISQISLPALLISAFSLALLVVWDKYLTPKHKIFQLIQGPIVVVLLGIVFTVILNQASAPLSVDQLVSLPVISSFTDLTNEMAFPAFEQMFSLDVLTVAAVMAIVASIETLLSVEATDKLDPQRNTTPTNRELKAQGLGNIFSGLLGGLPVTQVIVRSSANIAFGARSKLSAIMHGFFLLIAVVAIGGLLNLIPLASLAAVLIIVGYKLAKPATFSVMYRAGWEQFLPFMATIIVMLVTDLLSGVIAGLAVSVFFTLKHSYKNSFHFRDTVENQNDLETHHIVLAEEVSFFNKPSILKKLNSLPENSKVILDFTNSKSVAFDVIELVKDFSAKAHHRNISVETVALKH